jgi:hypothetical protein
LKADFHRCSGKRRAFLLMVRRLEIVPHPARK